MATGEGFPPQQQDHQPGREAAMRPAPESFMRGYRGSGKLEGQSALVTGGDSGIGRAVAIAFAREGADVAIAYLEEEADAGATAEAVQACGRRCLRLRGDVADSGFCRHAVDAVIAGHGRLDILVNNAAQQFPRDDIGDIDEAQLERTFRVNVFGPFHLVRAALPELRRRKGCIINTSSVTAYRGSPHLIDYAATKGALVAFTRSLAAALAAEGVRVNAVAPGPVWTPLIPASFDADHVAHFGEKPPLGRAGQPDEIAPSYVFLASADAAYFTGQVLHPNGGEVVNG